MWALGVVVDERGVEVGLQRLDGLVEGLAHLHPEELVEHGAVEALDQAVRLRRSDLGAAVLDAVQIEVELKGVPPYGNRVENRKLIIDDERAEHVRWIFARFLEIGSGTELAREVAKRDIRRPRGNRIDKKYLYRMLNNRAYIGEAVHKGESYPGEHDAIVDPETWNRVHAILQESPRKRAARTRADTPALLKGLLFGPDGAAFSPTHTRTGGQLYRYYVSQTVLKHGAGACPVGRVRAGEIEAKVIDRLRAVFRQPEIVAGTWKAARAHSRDTTEADARAALQQLDLLWNELFPAEQARIVALLVKRVDIGTGGLNVRLRVDGLGGLAREMLAGVIEAAA